MLTTNHTKQIICAELNPKSKIVQEIFYDDQTNKEEEKPVKQDKMNRYICPYCVKAIARIDNFKNHLKICKLKIVIDEFKSELKDKKYFSEYETLPGNRLELLNFYNPEKQLRMYISGQAGVGKSYLIAQFMKEYVRRYDNRKIYVFSMVQADKDIDNVVEEYELIENELFMRVDLNQFTKIIIDKRGNKKEDPNFTGLSMELFRNSLCIFDDIDTIPSGTIQRNINALKNHMVMTGRDHGYSGNNIDVIITNHQTLGGEKTKIQIQQCNYIVFFPQGLSSHGIRTICKEYFKLDQSVIKRILNLNKPHEYAILHTESPSFVLEQKKIWLIKPKLE